MPRRPNALRRPAGRGAAPPWPLALALAVALAAALLGPAPPAAAEGEPFRVISWSSPVGAQSLTFETLYGLKAFTSFLNAHGGVAGRQIQLHSLETDDAASDFEKKLEALILQAKPDMVVGGAANFQAHNTAEFLRRIAMPWFGPWTNDPGLYAERDDDPVGILPSGPAELDMLLGYVKRRMRPGQRVYFVYTERLERYKNLAPLARVKSRAHGIELSLIPISPSFQAWNKLEGQMEDGGFIILWTNPGPSAIIRRILGPQLPNSVWLTNSLNSPDNEVMKMSAGIWQGTIFPSVLNPSAQIPESYWTVMAKYALPGLYPDYQSYLGFAQGQILARTLEGSSGRTPQELTGSIHRALKDMDVSGSLLSGKRLPQTPEDPGGAYLAVVLPKGAWGPAQ